MEEGVGRCGSTAAAVSSRETSASFDTRREGHNDGPAMAASRMLHLHSVSLDTARARMQARKHRSSISQLLVRLVSVLMHPSTPTFSRTQASRWT